MSARFSIRRSWLGLSAGYVALIFFVSSRPYLHAPGPDFDLKDKLVHGVEYFGLGWFVARAVRPARTGLFISVLWLVVVGASIAAADEMFQGTVAGRLTDVRDWLADVIGMSLGVALSLRRAAHRRSGGKRT